MHNIPFFIKRLGQVGYLDTWQKMRQFTDARDELTADEFWVLEHPPVFTLGLAGKNEHILKKTDIPIIRSDRGGQVTYHGPGQLIIYTLINLKRANLSIRTLVERLEQGIINYLAKFDIKAYGDQSAPGVYVNNKKIASLGLKVRKNCTYHGISFNVNMDKTPFSYINVCGYSGLQVIQLNELIEKTNMDVTKELVDYLIKEIYR